jgi:hypothetical protein
VRWPDGHEQGNVTFEREIAEAQGADLLTVEDSRIRALLSRMPAAVPEGSHPCIAIDQISDKVSGWWSLWRISMHAGDHREQRLFAIFVDDAGQVLAPTAKTVWDAVIDGRARLHRGDDSERGNAAETCQRLAVDRGESIYRELMNRHTGRIERARKKGREAFRVRRKALDHIGLETVRQYRSRQLDQEEASWRERLEQESQVIPSLAGILFVRLEHTREPGAAS